ncbi:photosystem II assembly protein Psb35 [Synechococcus sp. PCC 7336]|uniref:photosystem II assembly protein Psb35 n=1 Tax=Synechococcus sp. PCC 7336 TaxID=195250 RepID=UPI00034B09FA|nr:hypothetical protein [Synechococcus sp. PCC 7336]
MMIGDIPIAPLAVGAIGFIAAVTLGSLAWYNSKRPAGWENAERPDFVPKIGEDESDS